MIDSQVKDRKVRQPRNEILVRESGYCHPLGVVYFVLCVRHIEVERDIVLPPPPNTFSGIMERFYKKQTDTLCREDQPMGDNAF